MQQTIETGDFIQAFQNYNRYEQFGYQALKVLFEYLEECDPDMELDVIALCCEYSHSDIDVDGVTDDDAGMDIVRDWLNKNTTLVGETDTGFVYCSAF